jgi:hypothetical protein
VAHAQQTIFNVPSPDVLDRGQVYFELDSSFRFAVPRFSSFVPRVVFGAGHRVEVGVNLTGNIQPGPDSTTLVPTIKWKPYDSARGWSVLIGDSVFIPLRNRTYDAGDQVYVAVAKTFKNQARISAGAYDFTPGVVAVADRAGGQFTAEYPLRTNITLAADWFTGNHAAGYLTVGLISKPHPRVTLYTAYSVGNANLDRGNHYFVVQLGYQLR